MRAAKDATVLQPSLFPMFNVLVCLLGSLVLVMGAVAAFSLGPKRTVLLKVKAVDPDNEKAPAYVVWDGHEVTVHPERVVVAMDLDAAKLSEGELDALTRRIMRNLGAGDTVGRFWTLYWEAVDTKITHQLQGTRFAALLESVVARSAERYLVVLVRPTGFDSFTALRNFLMRRGVDVGYEPIEQTFDVRVR